MSIGHVCDDGCWNACARFAKESRPEVGYWVTLEGHYHNVGNAKDGGDDCHAPDCEFLICVNTYLQ